MVGIVNEIGLALIILLYLSIGATYINSSDRSKRQYRRISSSGFGRGRGDAANRMRIYIARTSRSTRNFPFCRQSLIDLAASRNSLRRCHVICA